MPDLEAVQRLLEPHGLVIVDALSDTVLVGNAGSSLWPPFRKSPEYSDAAPHPMDRWSKRIGLLVAAELNAAVIFPFEGPPYPPILEWAKTAGRASPSPISLFIHREYGLWHAYRFVLKFQQELKPQPPVSLPESPCLSCTEQPCLQGCPVDAFSAGNYDVGACVDYLAANEGCDCRQAGCSARRACPFATRFRYRPSHSRFHMNAFLESQLEASFFP
jgi:hypothetical protein